MDAIVPTLCVMEIEMRKTLLATATALTLLGSGAAFAQATAPVPPANDPAAPTAPAAPPEIMPPAGTTVEGNAATPGIGIAQMSADELVGRDVIDPEGNSVGEVADLMLDSNQAITHVLVGVGGFLGIGERHVALELSQLSVDAGEDGVLVTRMTKEQLEALPAYEKVDGAWRVAQ
jgi:sporulation protein YlmC with PRC-barrel domain